VRRERRYIAAILEVRLEQGSMSLSKVRNFLRGLDDSLREQFRTKEDALDLVKLYPELFKVEGETVSLRLPPIPETRAAPRTPAPQTPGTSSRAPPTPKAAAPGTPAPQTPGTSSRAPPTPRPAMPAPEGDARRYVLWIAKEDGIMTWEEVLEKTRFGLKQDSFRNFFQELGATDVEVHATEAKISGSARTTPENFFRSLGWTARNWLRGLTMKSKPGAVRFEATVDGEPLSLRGLFTVVREPR
jgi:hypothetical protein